MILVTTDGSERSLQAIPHAAAFARATASDLGLLQVIDLEKEVERDGNWPQSYKATLAHFEDALRAIAADSGVHAHPLVRAVYKGESVSEAVLRCADEMGVKMIVMASRGHGMVRHALLGSIAMGVISAADLPVMVTGPEVGSPSAADDYRLLATTDGSVASEQVLVALRPFLPYMRASLLRIYVPQIADRGDKAEVEACFQQLEELDERLMGEAQCGKLVKSAADFQRPEDVVFDAIREVGADALAMSTRGHNVRLHVLLGSFAAACLARSPVPVILARR